MKFVLEQNDSRAQYALFLHEKLDLLRDKWPILSHHKVTLLEQEKPISSSKGLIHDSFAVAFAMALYSLSVDDLAIVGCFFTIQEMKDLPK